MDSDVKDIFELEKEQTGSRGAASLIKNTIGGVKVSHFTTTPPGVILMGGAGAEEDEEDGIDDEASLGHEQRGVRPPLL